MLARACLVLALVVGSSALAGCTDTGVVGEVMPLSTPPATCSSDKECGEGKRCDDRECVACDDDDCEPPDESEGCDQPDAACTACAGNDDCTSSAQPFCVDRMCVACGEDDDCPSHKCEHGACEADDDVEHQDDGTAGESDDNSGPGRDGEAGEAGSDDGP